MSTLNENGAASAAVTPKLEVRCELDRQGATAFEVPRRAGRLRAAATVAGLLVVLGLGWGAGLKTNDQVSTWFHETAGQKDRRRHRSSCESICFTRAARPWPTPG